MSALLCLGSFRMLSLITIFLVIRQGYVHNTLTRLLQGPAAPGSYAFVDSLKVVSGHRRRVEIYDYSYPEKTANTEHDDNPTEIGHSVPPRVDAATNDGRRSDVEPVPRRQTVKDLDERQQP